jgi:hypothetical protein
MYTDKNALRHKRARRPGMMRGSCVLFAALSIACLVLPQPSLAQHIFRWVDSSGRVHISDKVPEEYRSSATHYDAREFERTEEQKRQAEINRQRAAEALRARPPQRAASPAAGTKPGPVMLAPQPQALDRQTADCDALHLEFKQAQECFARFRTIDGVRGEAFQRCRDIPAPPQRCGLQEIYR